MQWRSLTSIPNLKLAWRRINTGRNLQYKRFFREAFLVYEAGLDESLKDLKTRLEAGAWKPSHAHRVYLPKPSGLQRPLSFLELEDQIILQAIANQFANRLRKRRKKLEGDSVFSNVLLDDSSSIFFTKPWQEHYRAFQSACERLFVSGYRWVGHFDLAAYYDTISHDLLISSAYPSIEPRAENFIKECLQTWSADSIRAMTGHGIPQGPVASDFLADGFFLPIDQSLKAMSGQCIRYVDDIRIFGTTQNEVRQVALQLEQECRHRGLIPQSAKFEVRELRSVSDAMGSMPSIAPNDPTGGADHRLDADRAHQILESALSGRPIRVIDKSRLRYVMYRAPADNRILNRVLQLLPRHPEHVDAFTAYFGNYTRRTRIARSAFDVLSSGMPYTYVRGELWHVIARLGNESIYCAALRLAQEDAKIRKRCPVLSWGIMHFLLKADEAGVRRIGNRLNGEKSLSRALLAPQFPDREFVTGKAGPALFRGSTIEQMAGVRQLQVRQQSLNSIGLRPAQLSTVCQNTLRGLGIIRRRTGTRNRDYVAEHLVALYQCRTDRIWRKLLDTEYEHALQIILEARVRYDGAYSEWLSLQDSFNDILVRHFIVFLGQRGLPGSQRVVASNGNLVKYGNLISPNSPFDQNYSVDAE